MPQPVDASKEDREILLLRMILSSIAPEEDVNFIIKFLCDFSVRFPAP